MKTEQEIKDLKNSDNSYDKKASSYLEKCIKTNLIKLLETEKTQITDAWNDQFNEANKVYTAKDYCNKTYNKKNNR